jgi:hypothetical protein
MEDCMYKVGICFILTLALCICTTDGLLAQGPNQTVSPPRPTQSSPRSSAERAIGRVCESVTRGADNRAWERERSHQQSGGGGIRGLLPEPRVWNGSWVRRKCIEAGGAVGIGCASRPTLGNLHVSISPVNTTIYMGEIKVILTGVENSNGSLRMGGWGRVDTTDVTISNWNSTQTGNAITGNFTLTFHPDDAAAGTVIVRVDMQEMVKEQ